MGINVPDANVAVDFFSTLFAAQVLTDVRPEQPGLEWKFRFGWHESSNIDRLVMLQLPDGSRIEVFQYSGSEASLQQPHEDDVGAHHMAFRVPDLDASLDVLNARGLRVLNQPRQAPDGSRWIYFLTPWGSQIELVETPSVAISNRH